MLLGFFISESVWSLSLKQDLIKFELKNMETYCKESKTLASNHQVAVISRVEILLDLLVNPINNGSDHCIE